MKRFTLFLLIGSLTLTAGAVALAQETDEQSKAISALAKLGGKVGIGDKKDPKAVLSANLNDSKVGDADLALLKSFPNLRELYLGRAKVGNPGMTHLAALGKLQTLSLAYTQVTDEGLKDLAGLKQLESLALTGTKVGDAGLKHLHQMKQLRELYLRGTGVSDMGVAELRKAIPKVTIYR
jgi:hypothetical protein